MGCPSGVHRASFPNVWRQRQHRANERVRTAILIDQSVEFPGFIVTAPIIHDKNGDPVNSTQYLTEVSEKGAKTGTPPEAGNDKQEAQTSATTARRRRKARSSVQWPPGSMRLLSLPTGLPKNG
jgi:hypothetical protein